MKPFAAFTEGHTAMHELMSTQTIITSLISDDGDQPQTKAIKELKTIIELYEQILVELEINEDKDVSIIIITYLLKLHVIYNNVYYKKIINSY